MPTPATLWQMMTLSVERGVLRLACSWACACGVGASSLAGSAQLRLTIVDSDTKNPVPCRIHLKDASGKPVRPKGLPFWNDHFVCAGLAELDLAPGPYAYEVDRGPEYLVTTGRLPGHIFRVETGVALGLSVEATLDSRDPVLSIEIIQNGRVARTVSYAEWKRTGSLGTVTFNESGWFLVRAFAAVPGTLR